MARRKIDVGEDPIEIDSFAINYSPWRVFVRATILRAFFDRETYDTEESPGPVFTQQYGYALSATGAVRVDAEGVGDVFRATYWMVEGKQVGQQVIGRTFDRLLDWFPRSQWQPLRPESISLNERILVAGVRSDGVLEYRSAVGSKSDTQERRHDVPGDRVAMLLALPGAKHYRGEPNERARAELFPKVKSGTTVWVVESQGILAFQFDQRVLKGKAKNVSELDQDDKRRYEFRKSTIAKGDQVHEIKHVPFTDAIAAEDWAQQLRERVQPMGADLEAIAALARSKYGKK